MRYYNQQRNALGSYIQPPPQVSHFSLGHDKIPAYSNIREEDFTLAHSLKEWSQTIMVKTWAAGGSRAAGRCSYNILPPLLLREQEAETRQEVDLVHKP